MTTERDRADRAWNHLLSVDVARRPLITKVDLIADCLIDAGWGDTRALREALESVEWVGLYCPWCGSYQGVGHTDDCHRQRALGADR